MRDESGAVDLAGVGTRYRQGELVLNGVDLEMERGRVPGIIGTNGSGKSTLLRSSPGCRGKARAR